jgi:hypothetical protein
MPGKKREMMCLPSNFRKEATPRPGSKEAIAQGCKCPASDNNHGHGYGGISNLFIIQEDCKLHAVRK